MTGKKRELSSAELFAEYIDTNDTDSIRTLLRNGSKPEDYNSMGRSALTQAVVCGRLIIVKMFIDAKVDLNARTESGNYPIIIAAYKGYYDIAKVLIDAQVNIHIYNVQDQNALLLARMAGHQAIEELLVEAGAVVATD